MTCATCHKTHIYMKQALPVSRCARPRGSPASKLVARARHTAATPSAPSKCVVLGGGIGGLVVAAKLAQEGYNVTLLEQNAEVGGRCQSITIDGYRFDTGPSLLLLPQVYRGTFQWLGSKLDNHVQIIKVEPAAYRVFFADGYRTDSSSTTSSNSTPQGPASIASSNGRHADSSTAGGSSSSSSRPHFCLDLMHDVEAMVQQLEQVEPGAGTEYLAWLSEARQALVVGTDNFIAKDWKNVWEFLDLSRLLPLLGKVNPAEMLGNHHARLARRFKSPRIRALLSFQDLYVGLSPYTAPGVFSLLAATEITDGVHYPLGGFGKVKEGLLGIAKQHGVNVRVSARVERIITANAAVAGVQLDGGEQLPTQLLITNRDVSMAYGLCDASSGVQQKRKQLAAKEYSAGVIAYYWCVSKRVDQLLHHNVFLSDKYKASWTRAKTQDDFQQYPNFYVHAPARTDPSAAPPGGDSIMVLLPVANLQERAGAGNYQALVTMGKQLVLNTFAAAGVDVQAPDIVHETVREPMDWGELYGLEHGAAFGMSHGLSQLALLRPPVKCDQVEGLYFVGASTRPGNGVPLVMMGARATAERVLADSSAAGKWQPVL